MFMDLTVVILIATLVILAEVSFLCIRSFTKPRQKSGKRKVYIDSSTLMDGRILGVAETGFIGDDLIIPRSVIREMQLLADGSLVLLSSHVAGWGDSLDDDFVGSYNAETGILTWDVGYAGLMVFRVILKQ